MLTTLPDAYPDGDMRTEALFHLALPRLKSGAWADARAYLAKAHALMPHEDGYFVAGRSAYFVAIADLRTGHETEGKAALVKLIADEPLTFAAAMAYAELARRSPADAEVAKVALEAAFATETSTATGTLIGDGRAETNSPGFSRAIELLIVGESDGFKRELGALGLTKESDANGTWLAASLLAQVGELRSAHAIARARTDWTRHFPAGKWRAAWQLAYPRIYADSVEAASATHGVPASIVWGVMREESAFDPEVVSGSDAYGLMQLIAPTAAHYAKPLKLQHDPKSLAVPEINIPIGTSYLRKLRAEFPLNEALAVPSYNAGEGATHRWMSPPLASTFDLWVESIPYEETRKYTKRVLASYYAYVGLYDTAHLDEALRVAAGK